MDQLLRLWERVEHVILRAVVILCFAVERELGVLFEIETPVFKLLLCYF